MKNEVFNLNPFAKSALGNFMKAACCFLLFVIVSVQWAGASENGLQISQQNKRTITGTVTDKSGEAIIGANIVEVGTTNGTVTDLNGHYTLAVLPDATLKISYIGYVEKTVKVGKSSTIDIVLAEDSKTLAEVVVVGYGTMDKKELTSAISHVSNKDFLGVASIDPSMQIQGKVPGLTITNTAMGDPNSGATIQIRGISSRSAGLGPLIVIDGVPGGNLHNINSNDIESIDVLKDGAASAIYGTRGSNGVIVITTKKGLLMERCVLNTMDMFHLTLPIMIWISLLLMSSVNIRLTLVRRLILVPIPIGWTKLPVLVSRRIIHWPFQEAIQKLIIVLVWMYAMRKVLIFAQTVRIMVPVWDLSTLRMADCLSFLATLLPVSLIAIIRTMTPLIRQSALILQCR